MVFFIIPSKRARRALHWNEIGTRVISHEGELLSGRRGREYQKKWSKKYLGKNLAVPEITADRVEKYEKTKK